MYSIIQTVRHADIGWELLMRAPQDDERTSTEQCWAESAEPERRAPTKKNAAAAHLAITAVCRNPRSSEKSAVARLPTVPDACAIASPESCTPTTVLAGDPATVMAMVAASSGADTAEEQSPRQSQRRASVGGRRPRVSNGWGAGSRSPSASHTPRRSSRSPNAEFLGRLLASDDDSFLSSLAGESDAAELEQKLTEAACASGFSSIYSSIYSVSETLHTFVKPTPVRQLSPSSLCNGPLDAPPSDDGPLSPSYVSSPRPPSLAGRRLRSFGDIAQLASLASQTPSDDDAVSPSYVLSPQRPSVARRRLHSFGDLTQLAFATDENAPHLPPADPPVSGATTSLVVEAEEDGEEPTAAAATTDSTTPSSTAPSPSEPQRRLSLAVMRVMGEARRRKRRRRVLLVHDEAAMLLMMQRILAPERESGAITFDAAASAAEAHKLLDRHGLGAYLAVFVDSAENPPLLTSDEVRAHAMRPVVRMPEAAAAAGDDDADRSLAPRSWRRRATATI